MKFCLVSVISVFDSDDNVGNWLIPDNILGLIRFTNSIFRIFDSFKHNKINIFRYINYYFKILGTHFILGSVPVCFF